MPCRAVDKPAGPALRDVVIPHHSERCLSPLGRSPLCLNQWRINGSPSVLSQKIFQDHVVEHRIGQQALELGVLIFQRRQPGGFRHLHAPYLAFSL